MARNEPGDGDEQILLNIYCYLELKLDNASSQERARMEGLPLWTGREWETRRPVYVVTNRDAAQSLSEHGERSDSVLGHDNVPAPQSRQIDALRHGSRRNTRCGN